MSPGQIERSMHDNARRGPTILFAVLGTKIGALIGRTRRRHRSMKFRIFLDTIERNIPPELDIQLVMTTTARTKATDRRLSVSDTHARPPACRLRNQPTSTGSAHLPCPAERAACGQSSFVPRCEPSGFLRHTDGRLAWRLPASLPCAKVKSAGGIHSEHALPQVRAGAVEALPVADGYWRIASCSMECRRSAPLAALEFDTSRVPTSPAHAAGEALQLF